MCYLILSAIFEFDTAVLIYMDSAQGSHPTKEICQIIRRYLEEYGRQAHPPISVRISLPAYRAKVPVQQNSCDCGVFLLKYACWFFDQHMKGDPIKIQNDIFRCKCSIA